MRLLSGLLLALGLGVAHPGCAAVATDATIPTYHGEPARSGAYVMPGLTWQAAAGMHPDTGFDGRIEGHVYAQPLYWRPAGATRGLIVVATQSDVVTALDAETGRTVWRTVLGTPVSRSAMPCGNINPLGITGTPVIDQMTGAIYLDAMVMQGGTPQHLVFGLRLSDGAVLAGWPIEVQQALQQRGIPFTPREQNQRSALALLDGRIFVALGGNFGDCGHYRGIVLGLSVSPPRPVAAWATEALKGGIWAPGGITSEGQALYFATGNTEGAEHWGDGEAVFRLGPDLARSSNPHDFFAPSNWKALDDSDRDLGGTAPLPIDLPSGRRLLALGKDGNAYLLNRDNLGGIGGQLGIRRVADGVIITASAAFPWQGRMLVVFQARRAVCPDGSYRGGLAAISIGPDDVAPAWCAPLDGRGAPIVTTTGNGESPMVWIVGAEGDDRLHAFRADTGQAIWSSTGAMSAIRHLTTILPAEGRLYIAGDGRVYAFTAR